MSVRVRLCCKPVLGRQNFVKAVAQPGVGAKKRMSEPEDPTVLMSMEGPRVVALRER